MILSKQSCLWIWCLKWNRQLKRACHSTLMRFAGLEEAEEHWQGSCFTTIWSHFLRRLNAGSLWSTSQVLLQLAQIFWEIRSRQTFTNLLSICIFHLSLHFTTYISLGELGEIQALCHSRWLCVHALWRKSVVVQASRGRSKDPRAACFGFFWDMFTSIHKYSKTSLPINLPISWIFLAHLHRRFLYLENYSPFCWVFPGNLKLANVQRLVIEESAEWSETVGLEQILEPLEPRAPRAGLLAAWHWETADYSQWSRSCVWIYVILHIETVCVCKLWKILYIYTHCICTISR